MSTEAKYLLRFDDICPTMNWRVWRQIERVLLRHEVKPILAVVPENLDPQLAVDAPHPDFWSWVRERQSWGWTIALHGYQHCYVNKNRGIMKLTPHSEFAGLPTEAQREKLAVATAIFKAQGVKPDAWVAPSHSFDWNTVKLLPEFGINVISDGLWRWPHTDGHEITWVPQQLWNTPRLVPAGVWTVCNHHNHWSQAKFDRFQTAVAACSAQMTSVAAVVRLHEGRRLTIRDRLDAAFDLLINHQVRPFANRLLGHK